MTTGYASRSVDELDPGESGRELSAGLGCTATRVVAYRLRPDDSVPLESDRDALVVPVTDGRLRIDEVGSLSRGAIGFVPGGRSAAPTAETGLSFFVVSADARARGSGIPVVIDLQSCGFEIPDTSEVATAWLTRQVGCTGMKVNARRLEPGQRVPYHTEGDQEELFVPIRGPASMIVDDTFVETPIGSITRVAPPIPRSAVNDGDEDALWVMVGAPPTGDDDGWDPGARTVALPDGVDQSASDSTPR